MSAGVLKTTRSPLLGNFEKKRLEFCIKPAISRGGRNVYVINNNLIKITSFQNSREKHLSLKKFKIQS